MQNDRLGVCMNVLKLAAFSDGNVGGNPAGVLIADAHPTETDMQRIAAELGFSETAFAYKAQDSWRVRYFSPQAEVPFCGHATIALGAALAMHHGDATYTLELNDATITVKGERNGEIIAAALQSPPTHSRLASSEITAEVLDLIGLTSSDLNPNLPPAHIHGGADHFLLTLNSRQLLTDMRYEFELGRSLMLRENFVTIMLAFAESPQLFHSRNLFAYGGVYEDPATGAASAAFGGYLRDIGWPHNGTIDIVQGEDMGMSSRIRAEIPAEKGSSIRVSGTARIIVEVD